MQTHIARPKASRRYTVTGSLVAARLEEDNAIHLTIADPAAPATRLVVSFPDVERGTCGESPSRCASMRRARQAFIGDIGSPPFEAPMLLYGLARLALVEAGSRAGSSDGRETGSPLLHVVGFAAEESPAPPPCTPAQRSQPEQQALLVPSGRFGVI